MDYVYNSYKLGIITGDVDLVNDSIFVALLDSYTPDLNAHQFLSDVNGTELANGNGYSTGGEEVEGKAVSLNNVDNRGEFSCNNVTWANASFTARYAVVYKDKGNPITSPVLFYVDFGENKTANNGNFTLVWHPQGTFIHNGYTGV